MNIVMVHQKKIRELKPEMTDFYEVGVTKKWKWGFLWLDIAV